MIMFWEVENAFEVKSFPPLRVGRRRTTETSSCALTELLRRELPGKKASEGKTEIKTRFALN